MIENGMSLVRAVVNRGSVRRVRLGPFRTVTHIRFYSTNNDGKHRPANFQDVNSATDEVSRAFEETARAMDSVGTGATSMKNGFNSASIAMANLSSSFRSIHDRLNDFDNRTIKFEKEVLPEVKKMVKDFESETNERLDQSREEFKKQAKQIGGFVAAFFVLGLALNRTKCGREFIRWIIGKAAIDELKEEVKDELKEEVKQDRLFGVESLKEIISLEMQRLQMKYSSSLSGSWLFSPVSRGYSHWIKIQALIALKKEIIAMEQGGGIVNAKDISESTIEKLSKAYGFDTSPETDDIEFRDVVLSSRMNIKMKML